MLRRVVRIVTAVLALAGLVAVAFGVWLLREGISAKAEPGRFEVAMARRMRAMAIPREARTRTNPEPQTAETLRLGLEHFADHCAVCHANDGSGDIEMGRGMYPRAPDMRQPATQDLSDGELFYIIEQGVRFTGMPAWSAGTADGEAASWHLVQFIRHLPKLSDTELEEMRSLNPRSAEEWREEEAMRRFLEGEDTAPASSRPQHEHGGER
jgi:mono/diheme cytochrome c family protein